MTSAPATTADGELRSDADLAARPQRTRATTDLLRLVPYLKPYRTRLIVMFAFAFASIPATIAIPLMIKAVIDGPVRHNQPGRLWWLGLVALALGVVEAGTWFMRRWLVSKASTGVEADVREQMYARLQVLPMSFHGAWQSGQLLSRIMNDLSALRRFIGFGSVLFVLNSAEVITVTILLLFLYWPLGLVVLLSIIPVAATVLHYERTFTKLSREAQDQAGQVATRVEESALGLRVIKSFGREDYTFERFDEQAVHLRNIQLGKVKVMARFWTLLETIPTVALIIVLAMGAWAVGHHQITMGTLVAFITLMLNLVWPIASLGFLLSMAQETMTAANRIADIFDADRELTSGTGSLPSPTGRLELRDVGFRFPDAGDDGPWVLRHVNLVIEPGETLALVGATGSGKSVLTSLIPRLYDVSEGAVLLDGVDVRELPLPTVRSVVATAFEDPTLFSMSVRENLTLGRPDASEDQIRRAIDIAQAQFVDDLPFGLDTRIGEQGMSLSGGQRQRLSLARAVLADPRVLVLDDTLSALDVHTEALVEEALRRVLHDVTGLIVAHRASTVLLADRVALLENGTISHVGRHSDLLASVPLYRYLLAADDAIDDASPDAEWLTDADRKALDEQILVGGNTEDAGRNELREEGRR